MKFLLHGDHPYARVTLNDESIANGWLDIWFDAVAGNVYEITLENSQDEEISCTIQLAKTPSLESITPGYSANISAFVGQTKQLYVSLSPVEADPGALVWESNNETVAKPVQYGLKTVRDIELLKAGTAHITVSAPGCDSPAVFTIEVSDTDGTMTLDVSQEVTLEAYEKIAYTFIAPGNGEYVLWSPMDDLTLEADGDAYDAGGDGSCAFEASEGDRFILSCWAREDTTTTINVSEAVPATGISLSPATISRCVGQECWINVLYSPRYSSRENLTWSSSNQEVVRISEGGWGRIELVGVGTATVTATTKNLTMIPSDNNVPCHSFRFTAPEDTGYIVWQENGDWGWINVFNSQGDWIGLDGGGFRQFDAKKGETYYIHSPNELKKQSLSN